MPLLIGSNLGEARLFLVAPATIGLVDEPALAAAAAGYGLRGTTWPCTGPTGRAAARVTCWPR